MAEVTVNLGGKPHSSPHPEAISEGRTVRGPNCHPVPRSEIAGPCAP